MNQDGRLRTWGDADFARKLVEFAKVEVDAARAARAGRRAGRAEPRHGPRPVHLLGRRALAGLLARRHREGHRGPGRRAGAVAQALLHLVGARGAAPRGRLDDAHGPPGPRPAARAAPRRAERAAEAAAAAELQRGRRRATSPPTVRDAAPTLSDAQIAQLQLDYQGRAGALRAVDDHVKRLVAILRRTGQLRQHADRLPVRQRLAAGRAPHPGRQVPALRGVAARAVHPARARRPEGPDGPRPGVEHRLRADPGRRGPRPARAARWTASRSCPRSARALAPPQPGDRHRGARAAVHGRVPRGQWVGPALPRRAHRPLHVHRLRPRRGEQELYDRRQDPYELRNVAQDPAYAAVKARLARELLVLSTCRGRACRVRP